VVGQRLTASPMNVDTGYLILDHEDTQLTLDAGRGGAIREFNWRDHPIFRPTPPGAGDDVFDMACFPMVPYVNRIAGGRFSFGARAVHLKRNWTQDPNPLHGQGWRSPWTIVDATDSSATLMFEGGADEWPWRYRAEQQFQLRPSALTVTLSVENLAQSSMPAMLGLHPYFGDAGRAQLQASAPRVWLTDRASLPIEKVATPAEWSFDCARAIAAVPLDNCFADWNESAVIVWPDRRVDIHASNCHYLHVYAPAGRDFFCVEPQSAAAGALTRGQGEAEVVAPGGRFEVRVSFEIGAA
jgi:aldose 1-epimerase